VSNTFCPIGTTCFVYDLHATPTGGYFWQFIRENKFLTDISDWTHELLKLKLIYKNTFEMTPSSSTESSVEYITEILNSEVLPVALVY
jgi:hypothetical protein